MHNTQRSRSSALQTSIYAYENVWKLHTYIVYRSLEAGKQAR